mmetsp:Transcript_27558/g.63882  ORF Transcript_27558/g.63882 Transcript_27558/m.63882 type:complete len:362 (-) Transcript_27558:135-1220(-)
MVAGLAFLSKKRFHPANLSNQKAVWEAQQQRELDGKKAKEREQQLKRERDDQELAGTRGERDQASLRFMYTPPPGMAASAPKKTGDDGDDDDQKPPAVRNDIKPSSSQDWMQRQPGDDDAAAAFRQMLAASASGAQSEDQNDSPSQEETKLAFSNSSGAALTGTTVERTVFQEGSSKSDPSSNLTALEKAVGRRNMGGSGTLEEQIARFPQLKNAPMAKGMTSTNVHVTFRPLGTQLRNVRCMACGSWGHTRGDRECPQSGWDPFSSAAHPQQSATNDKDTTKQAAASFRQKTVDRDDDSESDSSYEKRKKHRKKRRHRDDDAKKRKKKKRRQRSPSPDERCHRRKHKRRRREDSDSDSDS